MGGPDGVEMPRGKVVIVGDGAIGKTFLLTSLLQEPGISNDWDNPTYQPTACSNQSANWEYTDTEGALHDFNLEIWDTAGQDALRSLRNMAYPDTDIFLMAYDMTRKYTLEKIVVHDLNDMASYVLPDPDDDDVLPDPDDDDDEDSPDLFGWMSEITAGCWPPFQIILVGCKADLWEELNASGTPEQKAELTTWQQGYDVARAIGAKAYTQTSAKTYQGLLEGDDEIQGGPADTSGNSVGDPDGVWLKSKICELCAKSLADIDVPVVEPTPKAAAPEAGFLGGALADDLARVQAQFSKMSEWV